MTENIIKSEDVAPKKKAATKKAAAKKVADKVVVEPSTPSEGGGVIVYYESGAGYVTPSGFKFTRANPMLEIDKDEATILLRLPNFRLPTDEEKEFYYSNREDF
jgi:hypothetical protein